MRRNRTPESVLRHRLTSLRVKGFKALNGETEIKIGSLTILSGANSSGKSSAVQPFLLLKQTYESRLGNDLQLEGKILSFSDKEDILTKPPTRKNPKPLHIGFTVNDDGLFDQYYEADNGSPLRITRTRCEIKHSDILFDLSADADSDTLEKSLPRELKTTLDRGGRPQGSKYLVDSSFGILAVALKSEHTEKGGASNLGPPRLASWSFYLCTVLASVIYVPGVRTSPSRDYPYIDQLEAPTGKFDVEVASLLHSWKSDGADGLDAVSSTLSEMGFAGRIDTDRLSDTRVRVRVSRSMNPRSSLVNIADVGFGVSQALPVIVALLDAVKGEIIYIEQPEVHLHPRAQEQLAKLICETIARGVQVIIETHSEIMLLAIQTQVASGHLEGHSVELNWFTRNKNSGYSDITPASLDEDGRFGEWPQDFSGVTLAAQMEYIKSVHLRAGLPF